MDKVITLPGLDQAIPMECALEHRAALFAAEAHDGIDQRRKYTFEPYIRHPAAVRALVRSVPHTPVMLAAAWLHDVVEDTPVTAAQVSAEFGAEVADLVLWLTKISRPEDGNRAMRQLIERHHLACAPATAKTVKLADIADNVRNIAILDPQFATVYLREKAACLEVLEEGDAGLLLQARNLLHAQERVLVSESRR